MQMNTNIEIVKTVEKGRCAVASCSLSAGTTLLEECPFVGVNSSQTGSGIFPCHRDILFSLKHTASKGVPDISRSCVLTIRLLEKISMNQAIGLQLKSLAWTRDSQRLSKSDDIFRIASAVYSHFNGHVSLHSCKVYADIILRNSFTISDAELRPLGAGVFILGSVFNHSCAPNACQSFDTSSGQLTIRTTRDISPGEEVCIAYIDIGPPRHIRRRVLLSSHGFYCQCSACSGPEEVGTGWACQSPKCGGHVALNAEYGHLKHKLWLLGGSGMSIAFARPATDEAVIKLSSFGQLLVMHSDSDVAPMHTVESSPPTQMLPNPDDCELQWLYSLIFEAARSAPANAHVRMTGKRNHHRWGLDSPLGLSLHVLDELGILFQCSRCNSLMSLFDIANALFILELTRRQFTILEGDQYADRRLLHSQLNLFELTCRFVTRNHFSVFDVGSRLCIKLLNAQRFDEAVGVNAAIMTALTHCYPRYCPVSVLLHVQLVKLLSLWFSSHPPSQKVVAMANIPNDVLFRSYEQYTVLVKVAEEACGCVYGHNHSIYGDISSYV